MATELQELIQWWKDQLALLRTYYQPFIVEVVKQTITKLEELLTITTPKE